VKALVMDLKENIDNLPNNMTILLQLFDNVAFHAVTTDDTIIPCRKDLHGRYHVDGDLFLAPPEMLAPYIRNCLAIFLELAEIPKLVLSPLPRYLTMGCCSDPEHAPNRDDISFRRTIISSAERLQKALRDQLLVNGVEEDGPGLGEVPVKQKKPHWAY
jgi:hypothetical protein